MKLQGRSHYDFSLNKKLSCTGWWIEVEDLPLNRWTKEVYKEIGDRCGGLLKIDHRTETKQQIFSAKIRVRGNVSCFIPAAFGYIG